MATSFHSPTPPPSSSLHTPSTPRFGGFHDDYQPYSPRKSARVSQRARSVYTPPPQTMQHRMEATPHTSKKRATTESSDSTAPSSPQTATKKKAPRPSYTMGGRRVSGALNAEGTSQAASALGLPPPKMEQHRSTAILRTNGMLPTPDKTPKKAPKEVSPAITSIARNLFPVRTETVEDAMPSPKKSRKKYTLDSFESQVEEAPIAIFTDSHDRVPEIDHSLDNPFYGQGATLRCEPVKRATKRQKIHIPGEGEVTLEEAEKREDGLVYVFRGKKTFRKFADELGASQGDGAADSGLEMALPSRSRPFTRSSLKPRLLFPSTRGSQPTHSTEDEEADTDIEEPIPDAADQAQVVNATPNAPKFAPVSPSFRATRSRKFDLSSSPAGPNSDEEMGYQVRRKNVRVSGGIKRSGAPISSGDGKRSRH